MMAGVLWQQYFMIVRRSVACLSRAPGLKSHTGRFLHLGERVSVIGRIFAA